MFGLTETGMALVQWPGGDFAAAARAMVGQAVTGILGPMEQVIGLRRALGLADAVARHASDEPGFHLTLTDLRLPDCAGYRLASITDADRDRVTNWRADYEAELFATPPSDAATKAARDVARWQITDSHRVLWHHDLPVAISGFNAVLPEVVQIGGVYVPPDLRGRGYARRVVGMHLDQARAAGVLRAVLFAASASAERAYVALGFRPAGRMGLVLFDVAQRVAG